MYKDILVPIAMDSDTKATAALEVARALAEDGAKITLIHVMEQVPSYALSYMPADYRSNVKAGVEDELNRLASGTPNAKGKVVEGHSGRTILDYAEENGIDCIVIASHRPGMQDLLLGSTAAKVVRHAQCAVHVLR